MRLCLILLVSCSNYAFSSAALENGAVFEEAPESALPHSFYVNDLLKSMKYLNSNEQFVNDIINMSKSGGFHLIKFISNNKEYFGKKLHHILNDAFQSYYDLFQVD